MENVLLQVVDHIVTDLLFKTEKQNMTTTELVTKTKSGNGEGNIVWKVCTSNQDVNNFCHYPSEKIRILCYCIFLLDNHVQALKKREVNLFKILKGVRRVPLYDNLFINVFYFLERNCTNYKFLTA